MTQHHFFIGMYISSSKMYRAFSTLSSLTVIQLNSDDDSDDDLLWTLCHSVNSDGVQLVIVSHNMNVSIDVCVYSVCFRTTTVIQPYTWQPSMDMLKQ